MQANSLLIVPTFSLLGKNTDSVRRDLKSGYLLNYSVHFLASSKTLASSSLLFWYLLINYSRKHLKNVKIKLKGIQVNNKD